MELQNRIIEAVSFAAGVPIDRIMSRNRQRELVYARAMSMYLMRKHTRMTLSQIGKAVGGYDHATALHNITHVDQMREIYPDIEFMVSQAEKIILANNLPQF